MSGFPYLWSVTAADNDDADSTVNLAEGQLPGTLNNSNRAMMAAMASLIKDQGGTVTTGGTANAQTATLNCVFTALATGQMCVLKAGVSNTAAATLAINGLTAKAIRKIGPSGETAIAENDIRINGLYHFVYDAAAAAAAGAWIVLNPATLTNPVFTGSATVTGTIGTFNINRRDNSTGAWSILSAAGNLSFFDVVPATDGLTLTTAGGATLRGALTLSAGQIAFPAAQNASADANTLDDYEEGTWTPTPTFSDPGNLSVTYTTRVGRYTKIGRQFTLQCDIVTLTFTHTTIADPATSQLLVTGSPFTSAVGAYSFCSFQGITKAGYTAIAAASPGAGVLIDFDASASASNVSSVVANDVPTGTVKVIRFTHVDTV